MDNGNTWDLSVQKGELEHELDLRLQTIGKLQNNVFHLLKEVEKLRLERKWAVNAKDFTKDIEVVFNQCESAADSEEIEEIIQNLYLRSSLAESQAKRLNAELKQVERTDNREKSN